MTNNHLAHAKATIQCEQSALADIIDHLDHNFTESCDLILNSSGRCLVLGIGKSGHIARKIASTLASTGTPAFYIHPTEASHGDLGMITSEDVVIGISYSGETAELIILLPLIKRIGAKLIAITGQINSSLAQSANHVINANVSKEACPLGLAPTSSTTACLALGDALAIALLSAKKFSSDDFAIRHPGGSLGKRLLLRASDLMRKGDAIPRVNQATSIADALVEITSKRLGATTVTGDQGELLGIFTDGDLRRCLDKKVDLFSTPIDQVMTNSPFIISPDTLASSIMQLMQHNKITQVLAIHENAVVGIIHLHDLLDAGVTPP